MSVNIEESQTAISPNPTSRPGSAWLQSMGKSAMDTLKGEGRLYKNYLARQATSQSSFATGRQTSRGNDSQFGFNSCPANVSSNPFGSEWLLTVQSRAQSSGRRMGSAFGIGLASIALLPLGPIIMLIGGACGLVVGFICGVIFDWMNTKRTISLADKELKRLTYLVRFAMDEINRRLFTQSDYNGNAYCCHLLESVIMEFKPYVQVGRLSGSAIKKLKLLYSFLKHRNVHQCLWIYVNDFLAKWATNLTVSEFSRICRDVLTTLSDIEQTLSIPDDERLEVIGKVKEFLLDSKVRRLLCTDQNVAPDMAAIKHLEAVLVRDFYMDEPALPNHRRRKSSMDMLFARRNSDLLKDPTDTDFDDYQDILDDDDETMGIPRSPAHRGSGTLFKSFRDFMNFDLSLKHRIPISNSEFRFLYEKEAEPMDAPGWELAADKKLIKILKYAPAEGSAEAVEGTSVLVRAYATIPGVTIENVFYNIFNPTRRQTWDTNFANIELLPKTDSYECEVLYCVLQSPFGVTPRDFLQYRKAEAASPKCLTILMRSAEHELKPVIHGCIRAESHISGYVIRETPTGASLFIMSQTDVKGLIPKWIVNMMAAKAPAQWVNNLMRSCETNKTVENLQEYVTEQTNRVVSVTHDQV